MAAAPLTISIIQPDIIWEDKEANLRRYDSFLDSVKDRKEVVILPEMFATGFSMEAEKLGEYMDGPTVKWMQDTAARHRCILTGSLIVREEETFRNRMIWMQPDGKYGFYDKRHLFSHAGEDKKFTPGDKRLIVSVKGWKICLQVCYDLRFPVWCRQGSKGSESPEYDILLFIASWPERRSTAWRTLLQARAIENQSYCIGVNRVGKDQADITHSGDSSIFGPDGSCLWQLSGREGVHTLQLDKESLNDFRSRFSFLPDKDNFLLL